MYVKVLTGAEAREAALRDAEAALRRRAAELEAEHGARIAKAEGVVRRLQAGRRANILEPAPCHAQPLKSMSRLCKAVAMSSDITT